MTGLVLAAAGEATRTVQWNVSPGMVVFLYGSMGIALAVFVYGFWRRAEVWLAGRPEVRWDDPGRRLRAVLSQGAGQTRLLRRFLPGLAHAFMLYGFLVLLAATIVVFIDHSLAVPIMHGYFYLYFQSLAVDIFGVLALLGVGFHLVRMVLRRARGTGVAGTGDILFLAAIFVLLLSGFSLEGLRIQATHDPWAAWSPGGYAVGVVLAALVGTALIVQLHAVLWVFHVALWHSLLALVPFTRVRHALLAPFGVFFANPERSGLVPVIDFAAADVALGIRTPLDMTWKQLFDLDTCTECGRCTDACPAFRAGKPLSPRKVVMDLRDHVQSQRGPLLQARRTGVELENATPLAGGVIPAETLWACTTCRACEEACPVGIEHVSLIVQLRRNLAMEQADVPAGIADALQSLESRQHPFRGAPADREKWHEGLAVRHLSELGSADEIEFVYWVGCAVVSNPRIQEVARAFARSMTAAGVSFAILGREETCCGEPARRTGNEFHFDQLAEGNLALLRRYRVRRVVTHCAHCFQTLKKDYAQRGLELEVLHHSQLLEQLLREGRLQLRDLPGESVTFHDPCYLGRYNRVFDAPRQVLDRAGLKLLEMAPASGAQAMCCGAGGGHAFFQDAKGGKVNVIRGEQAAATGATTVVTACPFCLPMLEEGLATRPGIRVRDIAEVIAERLPEPGPPESV
jgi:Fe-S oxidoreductase/nitrate reductase gamma subunit